MGTLPHEMQNIRVLVAADLPRYLLAVLGDGVSLSAAGKQRFSSRSQVFRSGDLRHHAGRTGGVPGDGILIRNAGLAVMTHDVLVRHLRIRPGDRGRVNPEVNDALSILNPGHGRDQVRDVTFQWTMIVEGRPPHSMGWLSGVGSDRITIHHCLFAHNADRSL